MEHKAISTWGLLGRDAARDVVALTSGPMWRVTDLMPTDEISQVTFDARDVLRRGYFAAVIAPSNGVVDASVILAAVENILSANLTYLIIVTADLSATRNLLAMGEQHEILSVLAALDQGRIRLWEVFDAPTFRDILAGALTNGKHRDD